MLTLATVILASCTGMPPSTSIEPSIPSPTTSSTVTSTSHQATTTTVEQRNDLQGITDRMVHALTRHWTAPTTAPGPNNMSLCGRAIEIHQGDLTDESPTRSHEGIQLRLTTGDGTSLLVTIYAKHADISESLDRALEHCGDTEQGNPTDGWTQNSTSQVSTTGSRHQVQTHTERHYFAPRPTRHTYAETAVLQHEGHLVWATATTGGNQPLDGNQNARHLETLLAITQAAISGDNWEPEAN